MRTLITIFVTEPAFGSLERPKLFTDTKQFESWKEAELCDGRKPAYFTKDINVQLSETALASIQQTLIEQNNSNKITWHNVKDKSPQAGPRVMLVNSKFPSAYPVFAVLRVYNGQKFWKLMPSRLNADFEQYDLWAYTNQPINPHDPAFAQSKIDILI